MILLLALQGLKATRLLNPIAIAIAIDVDSMWCVAIRLASERDLIYDVVVQTGTARVFELVLGLDEALHLVSLVPQNFVIVEVSDVRVVVVIRVMNVGGRLLRHVNT